MARLKVVDPSKQSSGRPTRRATLERLAHVADEQVGTQTPLDQAFADLEALGPDALPQQIQAAQQRLKALLASGLDGPGPHA